MNLHTATVSSIFWAAVFSATALRASDSDLERSAEKPNILFIIADDLGWADVAYHGSRIKTPHIDRLAREGVELDRHYVYPTCISNRIGGDLISTSRWGGVQFREVLAMAGVRDSAQEISIQSADGFYESIKLADALDERTLLVYEMNGVPVPHEHGFPLRIFIPNRYGMKQPKWITNMEVIDGVGAGYWVERGWSPTAFVNTTSVIDTVAVDEMTGDSSTIPVGGIAFAGDQGISKVEVQVDDGPWQEATLRTPAISPLTWVQWRVDWESSPGRHTFQVRAYDSRGRLQDLAQRPVRPDGATGVHSKSLNV